MFKRLSVLTALQLGDSLKFRKIANKKRFFLTCFLLTLLVCGILFALVFVLNFVKNTLYLPVNQGLLTFVIFVTQILSVIVCTVKLMDSLYKSKDNAILLSFPARHNEVFLSKLIVVYLREFKKNLFFALPFLIAFGIVLNCGVVYYLSVLFLFCLLPFFPVVIGALLSIPLMYAKRVFNALPLLYVIIFVGAVALVLMGISTFVKGIPQPLRIIAIYTKFVNDITVFITNANTYALFYTFFTDIMFSVDWFWNFVKILLISGGLIALVYFISMPLYFTLAGRSNESSSFNKKIKSNNASHSVFGSFVLKELRFTFRNINQIFNNYFLIFMMPLILYLVNVVYSAILVSSLGENMIFAFNVCVMLLLTLSCNTQSATALSVEGGEFVLLKTAPSQTRKIVWAKLLINIVVSSIFVFASTLVLNFVSGVSINHLWEMMLIVLVIDLGHILWSFQLDLLNPKLREFNEKGECPDNKNVSFSLMLALIISLVACFISIFLLQENSLIAVSKILLIAVAFCVLRFYFFVRNLKVYFKRIEY